MTRPTSPHRRRTWYVNPRLQGGAALLCAAVIAAGGTAFGALAGKAIREMLLAAAFRGHYPMRSAFEIVRQALAGYHVALFAGIFLAVASLFLVLVLLSRRGIEQVVRTLRVSAGRDLSTPTRVRGSVLLARIGGLTDGARSETLATLDSIRTEARDLAGSGVPPEEFRLRWDELKQGIRGIAP